MKESIHLRPLNDADLPEHANMLYRSFNNWYWNHGWGKDYFGCSANRVSIFYEIYNDLTPGASIAAFDSNTGEMMGSCFYHPREYHVSLGIMSVHPDYSNRGVGRLLVDHILNFTKDNDYRACRVVSSAMNMSSFSLYNRAGFIPKTMYHDMVIQVPEKGFPDEGLKGESCVRASKMSDLDKMADLEMEISGIQRKIDYRYSIENPRKLLHALIYENDQHGIDGFMISLKHPALNMLGPCIARDEKIAIALIKKGLERFKCDWVLSLIPMEKRKLVEKMYAWDAKNFEIHLQEVWGHFSEFKGINMPSFLPETG